MNTANTGMPSTLVTRAHQCLGHMVDEIENLAECEWMMEGLTEILQRELRAYNYFLDLGTCRDLISGYISARG